MILQLTLSAMLPTSTVRPPEKMGAASSLNYCGRVEKRLYDLLGVQHVDSVEPDEGSRVEENEEREKRV